MYCTDKFFLSFFRHMTIWRSPYHSMSASPLIIQIVLINEFLFSAFIIRICSNNKVCGQVYSFFLTYVIVAHAQRVVDTEYGEVRGHAVNVDNGREQTVVDVFYAIPFAKAPIGALRFAVSRTIVTTVMEDIIRPECIICF